LLFVELLTRVSAMISAPLGSWLMETWGPSPTYWISLLLECSGFLVLLGIRDSGEPQQVGYSESGDHSTLGEPESPSEEVPKTHFLPLLAQRAILFGLLALMVNRFTKPVSEVLIQYMSARFKWRIADVS
jgi:hypothetical protein